MKNIPVKNNKVLLCLVWIHLTFVVVTIALFIWGTFLEYGVGFRWNLIANLPFLAWLSGIITFFVGIRKKKSRRLNYFLRISFVFWLLCSPIIIFLFIIPHSYYAASKHYVLESGGGFLSNPCFRLSRISGILKREVYVSENYNYGLGVNGYKILERPDIGAVVFTETSVNRWKYVDIVTVDTITYMAHKREVSALIDSCFDGVRRSENYCLVGLNPVNGWRMKLSTDDNSSLKSPVRIQDAGTSIYYMYCCNLMGDSVSVSLYREKESKDGLNFTSENIKHVTIPRRNLMEMTPATMLADCRKLLEIHLETDYK